MTISSGARSVCLSNSEFLGFFYFLVHIWQVEAAALGNIQKAAIKSNRFQLHSVCTGSQRITHTLLELIQI